MSDSPGDALHVQIAPDAWATMLADCRRRYPEEACGILIGRDEAGIRTISIAIPATNVWHDAHERTHRFLINPATQLAAERQALASGDAVLGFYHSHPDHPPIPSPRDAAAAWPVYSYVIVKTTAAGVESAQCWHFAENEGVFSEQPISPNDCT